jgi:hypothetical protein
MEKEIINRVANSQLVTFDLEDYYPNGDRVSIDISKWLYEGIVLKERDFRGFVENHNWQQYTNNFVALTCATDAIIPAWAYLLLTVKLTPYAKIITVGSLEDLEVIIYAELIHKLPLESFKDKPVIIKGCSHKTIPTAAFVLLVKRFQPIAKSIMYGEACSSVPLYKKK